MTTIKPLSAAAGLLAGIFLITSADAQVLISSGSYAQDFNTLASTGAAWTNNLTLPGWYAFKSGAAITATLAGAGGSTSGGIYSFGVSGANALTDRALGSLASASASPAAFGLRFTNDTVLTVTNILISMTGEQWRNGGSGVASTLAFACGVSRIPITNVDTAAAWTNYAALNFTTPTVGGSSGALDGNQATNRQVFAGVTLTGVTVSPGEELFLRWLDVDDTGSDSALAIDDLTVSFQSDPTPPNTNIVFLNTNASILLMTYNLKGNGATNWSTNATQVQAIGRQLVYLAPDIVTFNEIPNTNTWQMTNWVTAFLPCYHLAVNSATDGYIRSGIASRFPINRSQSWLAHADLNPFGYTNANFTRDLFEVEIAVPDWPQPLHVFVTHLKSTAGTTYADAAAKRAAEASAITNFFATNIFALHPLHPFTLSGDMNDSSTNALAIQELISDPTTLRLTNPRNPVSGSINTYSIQGSLTERIDFIFPCALLADQMVSAQVFRTDLLSPLPAGLNGDDDAASSDHLPVLLRLANPYAQPFRVTAFSRSNSMVNVQWDAVPGGVYRVETSVDLAAWWPLATNLVTTNFTGAFMTNAAGDVKFFRVRTQ